MGDNDDDDTADVSVGFDSVGSVDEDAKGKPNKPWVTKAKTDATTKDPNTGSAKPDKQVFVRQKVAGDRSVVKLSTDMLDKQKGINGDQIASEALRVYREAKDGNDAKFFDAFVAAIAKLTGVSAAGLFDDASMEDVMANFKRNVDAINSSFRGPVKREGDVKTADTIRPDVKVEE